MNLLEIKPYVISEALSDKIFLFYGEAGTRKTTVAAAFENSLLAAFEIGYKFIDGVHAQPLQKWTDFKKFVRELKKQAVRDKYETIVIDTVSLAYNACYDYVLQQNDIEDPGDLGFGKGWRLIRKEFEKVMLSITQMGYGLVLIAHSDEMAATEKKAAVTKVDIDKRPATIIKGLADFIFYLRKEYKDGMEQIHENKTVYAYTNLVSIESKTRSRYFTPRFEFDYKTLKKEMKNAIDEQKKVEGIITIDAQEHSLHEIVEESLEQLLADIRQVGGELYELEQQELVDSEIYNAFEGRNLGQTTNLDIPKLLILREKLLEIKSRL